MPPITSKRQSVNNRWANTQRRIIKTAAQNFVRNAWLSVAAMAVMVITLGIVLFSVIASATFSHTIGTITDRIDVSIFLNDDVTNTQRNDLINQLKSQPNVKSVDYTDKEQALKDFVAQQPKDSQLTAALAEIDNPVYAVLHVKPKDINRIAELQPVIDKPEIKALQAAPTSYSDERKSAIDNIANATHLIQRIGFIGIIVFAIVCMLIIFNTIQMAIFNRRDELTIMRLLGASTWFIRGPFIFETVYYGIVSALISVGLCHSLFTITSRTFEANSLGLLDISYANSYFQQHFLVILLLQLLVGIFIGAASSYIATRRYLKFKTSK